jgi:hypothetical protein
MRRSVGTTGLESLRLTERYIEGKLEVTVQGSDTAQILAEYGEVPA